LRAVGHGGGSSCCCGSEAGARPLSPAGQGRPGRAALAGCRRAVRLSASTRERGAMASYTADIRWALAAGEDFAAGRYSRGHTLRFDGGVELAGSASPHVVGKWAVAAAVDPEEMLVAAL